MAFAQFLALLLLWLPASLAADVSLLGAGPLEADGRTPATLHVHIPGLPNDARVRVKPTKGAAVQGTVVAEGIAAFSFVPQAVTQPGTQILEVAVKERGFEAMGTVEVSVVPTAQGHIEVSFDPPEWRPGTEGVLVRLTPTHPAPVGNAARQLQVYASAGRIDPPTPSGDGSFVTRWTPPSKLTSSRSVMFTAIDATAPQQVVGMGVLPALVKQSITLKTRPDSRNILRIGERSWGPLEASPAGTVAFDVEVHPAHRVGTLQTVLPDGRTLETPTTLPLLEYPRIALFPLPSALPAEPDHPYVVHIGVIDMSGAPLDKAVLNVRATGGTVGVADKTGLPGVYKTVLRTSADPGEVVVRAQIVDPDALIADMQRMQTTIRLIPALPDIELTATPRSLDEGVRDVSIEAMIKSPQGAVQPGRTPTIGVYRGQRTKSVSDLKDGRYSTLLRARDRSKGMVAWAEPQIGSSGLPARRLLMWPAEGGVSTDSTAGVIIAAVDAVGLPVAGVELALSVPEGGGTLPPSATTSRRGLARVMFTAGSEPGAAALRAEGAGLWTSGAIVQQAADAAPLTIPAGGSAEARQVAVRWRAGAPVLRIDPPTAVPVAAAVPSAPASPALAASPPSAPIPGTPPAPPTAVDQPSSGGPWAMGAFSLASVPHSFHQRYSGDLDIPAQVDYNRGNLIKGNPIGVPGVDIRGVAWPKGGALGVSARARYYHAVLGVGSQVFANPAWSTSVGGRYRGDVNLSLSWFGLAELHRFGTLVFQYSDSSRSSAALLRKTLWGMRIGGGVMTTVGMVELDAELSETLSPFPVDTHLGVDARYPLNDTLAVRAGLDLDFKHVKVSISGEPANISEVEQALSAGIVYRAW